MKDHILHACRIAFPERELLSISEPYPLSSNQHTVLAVHLHWRDEQGQHTQPLIYRRYPSPLGWYAFGARGRAAREFAVLNRLIERDLPVPPVYAAGCDQDGEWLLMGAVSGRNWWLPLGVVDFNRVLPGIVRQQVHLMARLHSLDGAVFEGVATPITVRGVLETYREAVAPLNDALLSAALHRVEELMRAIEEGPPCPINVDAEVANMLVDTEGRIVAWLDWDDAALGDRRWDLAALVNSLRGAYMMPGLAAQSVALYARETVRPVRHLDRWLALYAVLRWAQSAWLRAKLITDPMLDFPARSRFAAAYDSHRAWAMEVLREAEEKNSPHH